jgi:hypothetical protein
LIAVGRLPVGALDVEVVGSLAYAASGGLGLNIVDVTNPAQPVALGALDTTGVTWTSRSRGASPTSRTMPACGWST